MSLPMPEDIRKTVDQIKERLKVYLQEEFISKGRTREIEKLWLALEFPEYIRYKNVEWNVHSVELTHYEDYIINFMVKHLKDILPEEAIIKADLGYVMKFSTTSLRVRDLIYEALVEILAEDQKLKEELGSETRQNLKLLSRESKELALVLYLDGDIVQDGKLILCNTYLETIFMPTIRIIFRKKDITEEKLRDAVSELVKYGLIAHASWRFMNMLFNMYVVPPFLQDLWRELPMHIDVMIPKLRAVELEERKLIHETIDTIGRLIDEGKLQEAKSKLEELKRMVDKALLT